MSDPQQLSALRSGALRLSRIFDWERITRKTIDFYQTCL